MRNTSCKYLSSFSIETNSVIVHEYIKAAAINLLLFLFDYPLCEVKSGKKKKGSA